MRGSKKKKAPAKGRKKPLARGSKVVYPNVSRLDYAHTNGYSVRFERNGKTTAKLFSDAKFGGKEGAKRAAIAWRNAMEKKLGPSTLGGHHGEIHPVGYSYVKRMKAFNYVGDQRHEFDAFVGFLKTERRPYPLTKWSIDKWGKTVARQRCNEWLARKTRELELRLQMAKRAQMPSGRKKP